MASGAGLRRNKNCHVLNFFCDSDDGAALTVLVNGARFHIIADAKQLKAKSGPDARVAKEYQKLIEGARRQQDPEEPPRSKEEAEARVKPDSQDSGVGTEDEDDSVDDDSAVEVEQVKSVGGSVSFWAEAGENPALALKNWMLSPFGPILEDKAPPKDADQKLTVQGWYELPTFFYSLEIESGELAAKEEESTLDLERRMNELLPVLPMPKYIRNLGIPWFSAKEATVLSESSDPEPYHPSRVKIKDDIYFLKVVDPTQPSPTKREIRLLKRIEELGLHKHIRVPRVEGLLGSGDSHVEIIGFLQTDIEEPTPLTKLLDEDVPQAKREKWAKESERIKEVLHENDIVWGDAKADNFMVDKHDNLWIIDFGGSYTDGWIDPDLMETEEGDDMGVERIVNALHDPISNTCDPGVHQVESKDLKASHGKKRKADEIDGKTAEDEERADRNNKSSKAKRAREGQSSRSDTEPSLESVQEYTEDQLVDDTDCDDEAGKDEDEEDQGQSCVCGEPDSGDMVACDGKKCPHQWFHFSCVGLEKAPKEKYWYCDECKSN